MKLQHALILFLSCIFWGNFAQAQTAEQNFSLNAALYAHPQKTETCLLAITFSPQNNWYAYAPDAASPLVQAPQFFLENEQTPARLFLPDGQLKIDPFDAQKTIKVYTKSQTFFALIPSQFAGSNQNGLFTAVLCNGRQCQLPQELINFSIPQDIDTLPALPPALLDQFVHISQTQNATIVAKPKIQNQNSAQNSENWNFSPRAFSPELEVSDLSTALFLGLLAGLILNIMPCVLPVVSLKFSALLSGVATDNTQEQTRLFREHNLFFGLGILAWFAVLASLLGASGMAWGELFQSSLLVAILALLLFLLSLSLLGLFHLPVIDLRFDQKITHPKLKAFSTGLLTTLLATPCSGPLLGGVLGWTLLRPAQEIILVFLAIGLGMASPYFLILPFPGLVRFFPKPGAWLAKVEKAVALFLLAAVIYLVSILPGPNFTPFLIILWSIFFGLWLWKLSSHSKIQFVLRILAISLVVGNSIIFLVPSEKPQSPWQTFTAKHFKSALGTQTIVLDFTADWCPTCKALEATVLNGETVHHWSYTYKALFLRADLTHNSPVAEALLKHLGAQSIPLVAIFPVHDAQSPIIIRDLFTAKQLTQALEQATQKNSP